MESSGISAIPVQDRSQPQNPPSLRPPPETLVQESFTLRSQLFRRRPRTFLPFKQVKTPPRAEEWIENLGDVPVPSTDDAGILEQDWAIKTNSRGSCPLAHTLYYDGKAQSVWDPMPEEMLIGYLEILATIPYTFVDIVEEYLPGVFDPVRGYGSSDTTDGPTSPRWYPKPILIAACIFSERRILSDPRTIDGDSEDGDSNDEDSENGLAYPNLVGACLYNRYADVDSDTESNISYTGSISRSTASNLDFGSDSGSISDDSESDSDSDSDGASVWDSDSDSGSTCTEYSEVSGPDTTKPREDPGGNLDDAAVISDEVAGNSDDIADGLDDGASDLEDSSNWFTGSIDREFRELQSELERCGLELYSYI